MKTITSREFQKHFGQLTQKLRTGQTIQITKHGKSIGRFTKNSSQPKPMPDFLGKLESMGGSKKVGNQVLKEFNASIR